MKAFWKWMNPPSSRPVQLVECLFVTSPDSIAHHSTCCCFYLYPKGVASQLTDSLNTGATQQASVLTHMGKHTVPLTALIQPRRRVIECVACGCLSTRVIRLLPQSILFYEVTHGNKCVDSQRGLALCNLSKRLSVYLLSVRYVTRGGHILLNIPVQEIGGAEGVSGQGVSAARSVCLHLNSDTWASKEVSESVGECIMCFRHAFTPDAQGDNSGFWQEIALHEDRAWNSHTPQSWMDSAACWTFAAEIRACLIKGAL